MTGHWKYARIRPGDVSTEQEAEIMAWLATLGIDGKDCLDGILFTYAAGPSGNPGDVEYFLHVSRFVLTADGKKQVDLVTGNVQTTPTAISLGPEMPTLPWISDAVAAQEARKDQALRTWEEFRTAGLLWLLNASVLHPRGFALAFCYDDDRNVTGWKLQGDGSEPWTFGDNCDDRFEAVEALFAAART